ncbi:hypothetical protein [EBPR siphovirus 2]|nr:hypothetical protein [EBPR siphovirus 2]
MKCAAQIFEDATATPASLAECQAELLRLRAENALLRRRLEHASERLSEASWREEFERQEALRREDANPTWR